MKPSMAKYISMIVIAITMFMVSSCSFLTPVKTDLSTKYILNRVPTYVPTKTTHIISLLVSVPEARPLYNTTQMAYSIKPYQIAYFSQNEWAETPPQMLHPLLIQTLQNTHYFRAIIAPPSTSRYDYMLNTQILELRQDFTHRTPMLFMSVRAQLFKMSTNQVIATKQFSIEQPIPQESPYGGVYAANQATEIILKQIALFCLKRI